VTIAMPLRGRLFHSAPNAVSIVYHYRRPETRRESIGRTGAPAPPADLAVFSGGLRTGDRASIRGNAIEEARNERGYNMVARAPAAGGGLWGEGSDAQRVPAGARRMTEAIGRLAPGTVVVAAVKDEASRNLTGEAVDALRSLGVQHDLRGQYRVSHLFIGVK